MTYLFAKFGFIMLLCAFSASFFRPEFSVILAICSLFGCIGFLFLGKRSREISALFAAAVLGFGLVSYSLISEFYPAKSLGGMSAEIEGTVLEISPGGGNPVYTVETDSISIPGAPQNIKVLISGWNEISAETFDKISCEVNFITYSEDDIGEFLTNRSGNISVYAYTKTPFEIIGREDSSFRFFIHKIREEISSVIYRFYIDWHSPFMEQILIGNRGELETEITAIFRKSGMSHILAISGMHLVIITKIFEKALGFVKCRRKLKKWILVIAVGIYMFIGGLGMSVLRSGFMLIIHYLSGIFFSGSKSKDNLGIAVAAVIAINPLSACDPGFLMSVFSSLSITSFAPMLKNKTLEIFRLEGKRFAELIAEYFWVSLVAFLAVLPISATIFGGFSLASPLSNVFAGFFVQYSILFGILTVIFGSIPFLGFLAGGSAFLGMACNGIVLKIAELFSGFSFSYIETSKTWFIIWLFGSAMLIILPMIYSKSYRYVFHSVLMSVFVLLAGIIIDTVMFSGVSEIRITALEHGTAISCSKDNESVLITKGLDSSDCYRIDFHDSEYDVFISSGGSSGEELRILDSENPKLALLSTEEALEKYPGSKPIHSGKVSLSDGDSVGIISDSAFTFKTNGVRVLYIFKECDIMDIEPEFRRADIVILEGVSPEDFPLLRCKYLILRNFGGFYSGTSEIIVLKNGECRFFAYKENLTKGRDDG